VKINRSNINAIYTIFVFVALASLDNAVVGLFPPLFSSIAEDFNIDVAFMGTLSGVTILSISCSSLVWGYLAGKTKRKRLIIFGTVIWSISVFMTALSRSFAQLLIYQFFTGIGLGCIASIGFSVLTDYIPKKWLGMLMSLWGLSQGFGGIAGSIMASVIIPLGGWRTPFRIIAILGLIFIVLYFFIKEPRKGAAEPELQELVNEGYEYNYTIKKDQILKILMKKSNLWLMQQGFFMSITMGTLIWLPTLYTSKLNYEGVDDAAATIAAGYLYAILQAGGMFSVYFGHLGDKMQRRTYRGRGILGAVTLSAAIPLYILMFHVPMRGLVLPEGAEPIGVLIALIKQIFTNPWMFIMFVLAVGATAAQSAHSPNYLALITDVNLPEHRAIVFSATNFINGIGKALGNVLIGVVLNIAANYFAEPFNYLFTMTFFQLFLIPSVISYIMVSKNCGRDIRNIKLTLKKRSRCS